MTNTFRTTIARIALPVVSAGLIGGAALGMAGMANAQTTDPGFYAPTTTAHPAPEAMPGSHHHGEAFIQNLVPGYHR